MYMIVYNPKAENGENGIFMREKRYKSYKKFQLHVCDWVAAWDKGIAGVEEGSSENLSYYLILFRTFYLILLQIFIKLNQTMSLCFYYVMPLLWPELFFQYSSSSIRIRAFLLYTFQLIGGIWIIMFAKDARKSVSQRNILNHTSVDSFSRFIQTKTWIMIKVFILLCIMILWYLRDIDLKNHRVETFLLWVYAGESAGFS